MKSGFPVKDFTSSFADGQALCYLINYYFPALLPKTAIKIPRSSSFQQVLVLPNILLLLDFMLNIKPLFKMLSFSAEYRGNCTISEHYKRNLFIYSRK